MRSLLAAGSLVLLFSSLLMPETRTGLEPIQQRPQDIFFSALIGFFPPFLNA